MEEFGQGGDSQGPIVWSNAMSAFVLNYLAELVASGTRTGKGFKSSHFNACSRALMDRFHIPVNGMQVNHHLKKWRNRWSKINILKKTNGAKWNEETKSIVMDHDHYMRHIMKQKKDANFLNTPLMYYDEMATIFANGMASGPYAKSSTELLAPDTAQDIDTATDNNGSAERLSNHDIINNAANESAERLGNDDNTYNAPSGSAENLSNDYITNNTPNGSAEHLSNDDITNNAPNGSVGECSCTKPPNQSKRARVEDNSLLDNINRSLTKLAEAIEKIGKNDEVPEDLWFLVSALPGFNEEDLTNYFTYLCDNPKKARAFMKVPVRNRKMMAARFFKDNL